MVQPQQAQHAPAEDQKRARLDIRASVAQKTLIERAAALEGRSVSDYVLAHVQPAAEQTIQEHQIIVLTARESVQFIEALLNPPAPNERLRAAWREYKESMDG